MVDKYQEVITSDELKEFIAETEETEEMEEMEEMEETEEMEIRAEAQRLLKEYGDDFILIRYHHINDYVEDTVRECYSIPKELDWLFYHIDWDGVVRDMMMGGDIMEDEFCGITYYVEVR